MKNKQYMILIFLIIILLLFGCTKTQVNSTQPSELNKNQPNESNNNQQEELNPTQPSELSATDLENKCINLCKINLDKGINLSNGPCLGLIATDWVCDVAHSPRQEIDNLIENTCEDFANGNANHFIEVNETCKVIDAQ